MTASLFSLVPDHHLTYIAPALTYWVLGMQQSFGEKAMTDQVFQIQGYIFHFLDSRSLLSRYRVHSPAETATKRTATKREVIRVALLQQAAQISIGYLTAQADNEIPDRHSEKINWLAIYCLSVQSLMFGRGMVSHSGSQPRIYSCHKQFAYVVYWAIIPMLQLIFAMALADTWQYFTHRALHTNKWLHSM